MSAPQTNIETQQRRHRGPIVGIIAVVIFALGLMFILLMDTAQDGTPVDAKPPTVPAEPADVPIIPESDPLPAPDGDLPPMTPPDPGPDLPEQQLPENRATTP